jgi:hypothetical protein
LDYLLLSAGIYVFGASCFGGNVGRGLPPTTVDQGGLLGASCIYFAEEFATFRANAGYSFMEGIPMRAIAIVSIILSGLLLSSCGGGNSNPGTINGNWTAALTNSDGSPAFNFTTTFTQTSGTGVSVTNFNFTTTSPCFVSGATETGTFALSGDFSGNVTGQFGLVIQSGNPSGNTLTLQGKVNTNTITGTWTLAGLTSGCTGSGNFTMNKM